MVNQLHKRNLSFFAISLSRYALCVGEVEDAYSIDDLITSASITGEPKADFENLDFKIGSGLRKILTRYFTKKVSTVESKAQAEMRSLTGRQIIDLSKIP